MYNRVLAADFQAVCVRDGAQALEQFERDPEIHIAILDWQMPVLDGPEVCHRIRALPGGASAYLILATVRQKIDDVLEGFVAGANDYVMKPFHLQELVARVRVGRQVVQLQLDLAEQVRQLQEALGQVELLKGLLPICCYCKRIRDDQNYWQQVEHYISDHTQAQFSHSICPDCFEKHVRPELARPAMLDEVGR